MYEIYLINSNKTNRHLSKFSLADLAQLNLNQPIDEKNNNALLKYKTETNIRRWRPTVTRLCKLCLINFRFFFQNQIQLRFNFETQNGNTSVWILLFVKHEKSYVIHEEFDENQRSMSRNKHALPPAIHRIHAKYAKASEKMYVVWVSYVIIDQVSNFD